MARKGLTIDIETGKKKLETFIDDQKAVGNDSVSYSGKFVDENIISISHKSDVLGEKEVDESEITNKYVISYNEDSDKLEYKQVENLIEVIDCGYF